MSNNNDYNPWAQWQRLTEENLEKWLAYWTSIMNAWTKPK